MAGRRGALIALTAVGVGGGYYLYSAGGDPKLAEKNFEHDAARLSSKVKSEIPGKATEYKKEAQSIGEQVRSTGQQAGSKIDSALQSAKTEGKNLSEEARRYAADAQSKASTYSKDAEAKLEEARAKSGANLMKGVDKFDKTVEDGAAKTKSAISSWFGGK